MSRLQNSALVSSRRGQTLRNQVSGSIHLGLVTALTIAGFLASYLRRVSLTGSGTSSISLAGVAQMALLAALAYAILLLRRLPRTVIPLRNPGFVGFIVFNLIALVVGMMRYDLYDVLIDANWIVWIGFYFIVTSKPSKSLLKKLGFTLYLVSILRYIEGFVNLAEARGTLFLTTGGHRFISGSAASIIAAGFIISLVLLLLNKTTKGNLLIISIALVQLLGIIISFNRQTWVALAFTMLVGLIVVFRRRPWQLLILVTSFTTALLVILADPLDMISVDLWEYLLNRIGARQDLGAYLQDSAIQFRFSAWKAAYEGILENPILGKGWGSPLVFTHHGNVYDMSPHNTYLWLAYKAGIPALCLFIGFMTRLLARSLRLYVQWVRRGVSLSVFLIASTLIQIAFLVGALWWDYFTVMYLSVPIWLNTGVLYALPFLHDSKVRTIEDGFELPTDAQ